MNELKDIKQKLLLTAGILGMIALMYITGFGCLFRRVTTLPCLGCGMTRAMLSALKLDFATAFQYHAMFWAVPLMYLYLIYDLKPFRSNVVNYVVGGVLIVGFIGNWIYQMFFGGLA